MAGPTSPPGRGWTWIPTLYFAQGLPYAAVMSLSVVMYKQLGLSNTENAFYTGWLYLPWIIKPLWSPAVDLWGTKRRWIGGLQIVLGVAFAAVAFTLPGPDFLRYSLAALWLMAFSSATHDIAADGFYLLALPAHHQAAFVGVRSTFYRIANIATQGGLVYLAGQWLDQTGDPARAWSRVFALLAAVFAVAAVYHLWVLPRPEMDRPLVRRGTVAGEFLTIFVTYFRRPGMGLALFFLLTYRLPEALALKLVAPFLLDPETEGGLGLSTQQLGVAYGTIGVVALTLGGIAGGLAIARFGLKRMLWPMLVIMHAPIAVFLALATARPDHLGWISGALALEQFGYGFGFTAYMVYLMFLADGPNRTAHYAIGTGFMALGMMVPGMAAGWLQDHLGYVNFYALVCAAAIPSFLATALVKVDPEFGKKA